MKRQIFDRIRGRIPFPQSLYQHLHFTGPFRAEIDPDHHFLLMSDGSFVENEIFWAGFGGSWERTSLRVWAALCRNGDGLIFDIGANTGVYALSAAALAPAATIVAFEPIARIAEMLAENVALNKFPIAIEQKAVSDRSGRLPIYDTLVNHNYSASLEGQGPGAASYEVDIVSIDDWLAGAADKSVTAIKIDVERHEPAAIRGMSDLLSLQSPPILIEILDEAIGAEIGQLIEGRNYSLYRIEEQRGLIPTEQLTRLKRTDRNHLLCTAECFERAGLDQFLVR